MSRPEMYEVVSESRFEICLEFRTLEDATSVLYTDDELKDLYNSGEELVSWYTEECASYPTICDYKYGPRSLIYLDSLLGHIKHELSDPKKKEVSVGLSERGIISLTTNFQKYLKLNGVMCRPSTGTFVRFKAKPKKVEVKKSILWRMKSNCVNHLCIVLNKEYGLDMEWKGVSEEKVLRKYVKLGMKLGYTVDNILCGLPFFRIWKYKDGNGHYEYYQLDWYLENQLFEKDPNKDELIKLHKQEFRKWLEEIVLL